MYIALVLMFLGYDRCLVELFAVWLNYLMTSDRVKGGVKGNQVMGWDVGRSSFRIGVRSFFVGWKGELLAATLRSRCLRGIFRSRCLRGI